MGFRSGSSDLPFFKRRLPNADILGILFVWPQNGVQNMSMDKSLRRKNTLSRTRNVLTRAERVEILKIRGQVETRKQAFRPAQGPVLKIGKKSKKTAKAAAAEGGDKKEAGKK